jgi:hypothetical protein
MKKTTLSARAAVLTAVVTFAATANLKAGDQIWRVLEAIDDPNPEAIIAAFDSDPRVYDSYKNRQLGMP